MSACSVDNHTYVYVEASKTPFLTVLGFNLSLYAGGSPVPLSFLLVGLFS